MGVILALNQTSVDVCNALAERIPVVNDNICDDTHKLIQIYESLAPDLGVHSRQFEIMLLQTEKTALLAKEEVQNVSVILRDVANRISDYLSQSSGSDDSPKVKTLGRRSIVDNRKLKP